MVLQVQSAGFKAGDYAKIILNDHEVKVSTNYNNHYRGLHIVVINHTNCKVEFAKVFDTNQSS